VTGSFDDFGLEARQDFGEPVCKNRSLIGAVGVQLLKKRKQALHRLQKCDAAIAVLNAGGMHDGMEQQTQRIYEYVALLALDLLARVIAMRIDAGPPFSALFTLWLSMIAAVGLASRSSFSRQAT
jgi:hypothetical protein